MLIRPKLNHTLILKYHTLKYVRVIKKINTRIIRALLHRSLEL